MRLINADELIVMEYGGIKFVPKEFIDDAPKVDAVEVVRCKNCKNSYTIETLRFCRSLRNSLVKDFDLCVADGDFCSFAERRQDETD